MRTLFCVDHTFLYDGVGNVYSEGQFPYDLWLRYLDVFDELTIVTRGRRLMSGQSSSQLYKSSGPRVSFLFVPSMRGPVAIFTGRLHAAQKLAAVIESFDAVIARLPSETGLLGAALARKLKKPLLV